MKIFIQFSTDCQREYILTNNYDQALEDGDTVQINLKHPALAENLTACIVTEKGAF